MAAILGCASACRSPDSYVSHPSKGNRSVEFRFGASKHDAGMMTPIDESGFNFNAEALIDVDAPSFSAIGNPRPHLGASLHNDNQTNVIYSGLTWDFDFFSPRFSWGFSLGGAYHDGPLDSYRTETTFDRQKGQWQTNDIDQKGLGSRLLFRESLFFGFHVTRRQSILLFADHISNGFTNSTNEGMDSIGLFHAIRF